MQQASAQPHDGAINHSSLMPDKHIATSLAGSADNINEKGWDDSGIAAQLLNARKR